MQQLTIPADYMALGSLVIGIAGFLVAIWQVMKARRAREVYRLLCESRCKSIVESVRLLSGPVDGLCALKFRHMDALLTGEIEAKSKVPILRRISDQIHAIYVSKEELVRFCRRLNDEHQGEFGAPVYDHEELYEGMSPKRLRDEIEEGSRSSPGEGAVAEV